MNLRKVSTFIMAGGKGERLYPLTRDRAKPAVPFGGVYRIIDFTLSNCINSGIRNIHVLTQYKSISLARHIRMGWNVVDGELGECIDIIPAQQRIGGDWYQGTADSIYQNLYSIEIEAPDYVLILAGDHVYKMNYAQMLSFHKQKGAGATVGVIDVEKEKANQLGVIEVEGDNKLTGFEEKPNNPKTLPNDPNRIYGSMGIYIFNRQILEEVLRDDAEKDSKHDFGRNIIPAMLKKYKVYAYNFESVNEKEPRYWRDVGDIDAYYEANMDLVQITPVFNLYDRDWLIRTYQGQFPPVKTVFNQEEDSRRGIAINSLVSSGSIISGGRVENSILSPNVRVNSFSQVYDSVIMEGVNIGRRARLKRVIIDKDVNIPEGMEIGYNLKEDKKRFHVTNSGIVVVAKGTELRGHNT